MSPPVRLLKTVRLLETLEYIKYSLGSFLKVSVFTEDREEINHIPYKSFQFSYSFVKISFFDLFSSIHNFNAFGWFLGFSLAQRVISRSINIILFIWKKNKSK